MLNSQNKRADLDGNFFGGSAVTVKSLYKLALHKILLGGAFVRVNIFLYNNYYQSYDLQEIIYFIII